MVETSVRFGFPGKLLCFWQAAHHIYLFADPWCEQHRTVGAWSDVQKGLLGQAHHSPGHWQCLDGTVTLMRQNLVELTHSAPRPHPVTANRCCTG